MSTPLIVNGVPWFDDRGQTVNAHGACLVEQDGRYYLFGEYKTDDKNTFIGFSCYSSPDLVNWTFENLVLPQQPDGLMGPGRIGERVKVMRSPATGKYVMFMHSDNLTYTDPHVGVAISDSLTSEFTFLGALEFAGEPIRRWDIGSFQDDDGTGYLLVHEGDIYRLSDDYLRAETRVSQGIAPGGESPAMLVQDGQYYALFSNKTSWESNDNIYLTAPSLSGPWTYRGLFAPGGSLTWNSQCSFVFPLRVNGQSVPMYMGDRWSFPHQGSAATAVWLPLQVDSGTLKLEPFWQSWNPLALMSQDLVGQPREANFVSDLEGETWSLTFTGSRISLVGTAQPSGAYAHVELKKVDGTVLTSSFVTFYAKVPHLGLRYVSPVLDHGEYVITATVTGRPSQWTDKSGQQFGSIGTTVSIDHTLVAD